MATASSRSWNGTACDTSSPFSFLGRERKRKQLALPRKHTASQLRCFGVLDNSTVLQCTAIAISMQAHTLAMSIACDMAPEGWPYCILQYSAVQ